EACPSHAIIFGDMNDQTSQVSQILKSSENRYDLLESLNTRPAVKYLTKVRNSAILKGENESFNKKAEHHEGREEGV
ncbi:hypothetical protein ACSTHR_23240, partial [Vibrio parahaemolyticus]